MSLQLIKDEVGIGADYKPAPALCDERISVNAGTDLQSVTGNSQPQPSDR